MGHQERTRPDQLEDEFLRQLAGGGLAGTRAAPSRQPRRQPPPAPRGATNPHALHPLGRAELEAVGGRRNGRRERAAADQRRRGWRRGRLAAWTSLAASLSALALVLLGARGDEPRAGGQAGAGRGAANGSPAADPARLRVRWAAGRGASATARWRRGGSAIVAGRLVTPAGRPVAGARVGVLAADAARPEQGSRTVGELRTGRDGRFRAAIALDRGAARKLLRFSYLAHADDTVPAALARAELGVEAPIGLRSDGQRVRAGGSLELAGRSAPGAAIALLAEQPRRGSLQAIARLRAARDGRFRASVRVPRDAAGGIYRFRARAAADRERYLGATSDPVEVEVDH